MIIEDKRLNIIFKIVKKNMWGSIFLFSINIIDFVYLKKKLYGFVIYCCEENDRNNINDVVFFIIKWEYELIYDFSFGMCMIIVRCFLILSV